MLTTATLGRTFQIRLQMVQAIGSIFDGLLNVGFSDGVTDTDIHKLLYRP